MPASMFSSAHQAVVHTVYTMCGATMLFFIPEIAAEALVVDAMSRGI
jgi:hypothetical protein